MDGKSIYKYTLNREKVSEVSDSIFLPEPEKVANFLRTIGLASQEQEHIVALILNSKNMVVGYYSVVVGLVDMAYAHAREVFRYAIMLNASSSGIVLAHNHPSGICTLSPDDIRLTTAMTEAGKIIGISLLDHVIVAENEYFSFREKISCKRRSYYDSGQI